MTEMKGPRPAWTVEERNAVTAAVHEATQAIDDAIARTESDARELGQRGWTIPTWTYPNIGPLIVRTIPAAETDAVFVALYEHDEGAELDRLAARLGTHPELRRWWPLLSQCVAAYRRGEYLIVVPSLLTILEGVLAAVTDRFTERRSTRVNKVTAEECAIADSGIERTHWASLEAFSESLFQEIPFGDCRPSVLNRHRVLHGRDDVAWTQADCLRLFQAIDTASSARLFRRQDMRAFFRDPTLYDELQRRLKEIEAGS